MASLSRQKPLKSTKYTPPERRNRQEQQQSSQEGRGIAGAFHPLDLRSPDEKLQYRQQGSSTESPAAALARETRAFWDSDSHNSNSTDNEIRYTRQPRPLLPLPNERYGEPRTTSRDLSHPYREPQQPYYPTYTYDRNGHVEPVPYNPRSQEDHTSRSLTPIGPNRLSTPPPHYPSSRLGKDKERARHQTSTSSSHSTIRPSSQNNSQNSFSEKYLSPQRKKFMDSIGTVFYEHLDDDERPRSSKRNNSRARSRASNNIEANSK